MRILDRKDLVAENNSDDYDPLPLAAKYFGRNALIMDPNGYRFRRGRFTARINHTRFQNTVAISRAVGSELELSDIGGKFRFRDKFDRCGPEHAILFPGWIFFSRCSE